MLIEEFTDLTGIYPTANLYEEIERRYMESNLDKQTFCKKFKKNADGIAEAAAQTVTWNELSAVMKAVEKAEREFKEREEEMCRRIAYLEFRLDDTRNRLTDATTRLEATERKLKSIRAILD